MDTRDIRLPAHHRTVMDRFVAACRHDERVVAAFLGGSYARGAADAYSDLDLYLITTDADHEDILAGRQAFMRLLGEPVFLEDFDLPDIVFYVFSDGAEGEIGFGRESQLSRVHRGPYLVLLDKKGILSGAIFTGHQAAQARQIETLRRQICWFWHDLSHFITAMGRGQLWWAWGQLEVLRASCVTLARLRQDISDTDAGDEAYFKVEQAIPVESLSALRATFCSMEAGAMFRSALVIVRFYQELAPRLADRHGTTYPAHLERVMMDRLEKLRAARFD